MEEGEVIWDVGDGLDAIGQLTTDNFAVDINVMPIKFADAGLQMTTAPQVVVALTNASP